MYKIIIIATVYTGQKVRKVDKCPPEDNLHILSVHQPIKTDLNNFFLQTLVEGMIVQWYKALLCEIV